MECSSIVSLPFLSQPVMVKSDFQDVLLSSVDAYEEGLAFFRGEGMINKTLERLTADLEARGIDYCIIGAVALNQHGYQRFTVDIDLLLSKDGLTRFRQELVGRGYRPAFEGATKSFRAVAHNVPIDVVTVGEYPGDGKPKPIRYEDPREISSIIGGIRTVTLERLIEFKLASGMTAPDRLRDLADVQEVIRTVGLESTFAERLNAYVRPKFLELHQAVDQARNRKP